MHDRQTRRESAFRIARSSRARSAMTLIELLIVIVIIGVLVSAVMVASTSLIGKSKSRNTQAVLQIVADAAEQYKRSESERPTISKHARYKARYGLYPPDELEVFSPAGVPRRVPNPALPPTGNLATPIRSVIIPLPTDQPMRFYTDGTSADWQEHRDLAALIVAIESQGGEAAAILDRISDRNRSAGVLDPTTKIPAQFLDRPVGINDAPSGGWDADDLQIRYILDDWGIPISYMAQRDFVHGKENETKSSNHLGWNEASTEFIRINGGQPVVFSYGPNGKEQLTQDAMGADGKASLPGDFVDHKLDQPFNDDNVYLNEQLREKLSKGIDDHG